jgi:hypothetical protein
LLSAARSLTALPRISAAPPVLGSVDSEGGRIGRSSPERLPGFSSGQEFRRCEVLWAAQYVCAENLGVESHPSDPLFIPVLSDPEIQGLAWLEASGEAAAHASVNSDST